MSRVFKLRVPGDPSLTFAPLRTANYKLTTAGYATFVNEATDVAATDMVFTGSKSNLRRMDALESNVSKLFIMMRSVLAGDGDSINLSINSSSTTRLVTSRTLSVSGDANSSGVSFNGTANATIPITLNNTGVTAGTYLKVSVDAKGRVLLGLPMTAQDVEAALGYTPAPTGTGTVEAANRLTTPRNFNISGGDAAVGGTVAFDGSANASIPLTLANTGVAAGTYNQVVVDAKGRVTAAAVVGFLTGETDTLQTVTTRGATTNVATVSLTANTATSNTTTGALVVTGGVGIGGGLNIGGNVGINATTVSSSTGSGALVLAGGLGVAGAMNIGGAITSTNNGDALFLNNGTQNWLRWNTSGTAAPTFTSRSAGTKLVLREAVAVGSADYAVGINTNVLWFSVPTSTQSFQFHGGTFPVVTINGTGQVTVTPTTTQAPFVIGANGQGQLVAGLRAATADTLTTSRNLSIAGGDAATGATTGFNGSGNATLSLTLTDTGVVVGTYSKVSVDAKGRVLAGLPLLASDVETALGYSPIGDAGGTFTGDVTITGNLTVTGTASAADPTADSHLTTRSWVEGRSSKQSARVATTANININSPGATIDGVTLTTGDRVLVRAQTNTFQSGIYIWNGAATPMTRASDANSWADLVGATVSVQEGTLNADSFWICISDAGGTLGVTTVSWRRVAPTAFQISGGDATAGTTVNFDGLNTIILPVTLTNTGVAAGTYNQVVVNAQGRVVAAASVPTGESDTLQSVTTRGATTDVATISLTAATSSTSTGTGALVVTGGVGIGGNAYVGGKIVAAASTTTAASLTLPHGAAPTSPVNGDIWTTTTAILARINGTSRTVAFTDSNITGSAASLTTARNFNISGGDAAAGATTSFNGTANATLSLTLTNTGVAAGTYNQVVVDAKGRVTSAAVVGYLTGNQTITLTGDASGTGTTSIPVTLANTGVVAGTYNQVVVDAKGRVISAGVVGYLTGEVDTLASVTGRGATTGVATISLTANTVSSNTTSGALVVTGGVGIGGALNVGGNVAITGNLTVTGTTTTTNSNSITLTDALLYLSSNATTATDTRDRGIAFNYGTGSAVNTGFFGWDQSVNRFVFVPNATITSDVVSGSVGTIEASLFGNATTATTLQTSRNFNISGGDAAAGTTVGFNGSGNVSLALTLANTGVSAGTYNNVSVDAKGRVLTGFNVSYLTGNQTITLTGDASGSGTTSIPVTLANTGVAAGTYNQVAVDAKGRVLAGFIAGYLTNESDTLQTVTGRGATTNVATISLTANTASTSTATGALVVTGGVGIGGNAYVGGDINMANAGKIIAAASTTTAASLNLPHGTAPSAPVNGDIWTTTTAILARINGTSRTVAFTDSNITGSAASLTTARNFNISGGDAAAGATTSFNGTANATLSLTLSNTGVAAGTYNQVSVDAKGRVLAGFNVSYLTDESDTLATVTSRGATTSVATVSLTANTASTSTSTGALVVTGGVGIGGNAYVGGDINMANAGKIIAAASTTTAASLNLPHGTAPTSPVNGDIWTTTTAILARINGTSRTVAFTDSNITGSAASLTTTRAFNTGGGDAATGTTVNFNGTGNVTLPVTLTNTGVAAGTYNQVVVNAQGRVTSAAVVGYLTGNQTITLSGDASGTGTTNIPVTLASTGVTAGTYNQVSVDAKGRVLAGFVQSYLTAEADTLATVTGRGATTGTAISLTNATASTSTTTGALVVTGGVGIGGNAYVGGDLNMANAGKIIAAASTTTAASINLPHGTAPTTPVNGDVWTTTTAILARINGTSRTVAFTDSNITGSAASLTTARNFNISGGDAAAGATTSFNGTANATLSLTLSNTGVVAGTYLVSVVDAKGRVTSASNSSPNALTITSGTASSSTATGALVLSGAGGAGIGGNLNVGGSGVFGGTVSADDPTADSNLTTRQWVEARSPKQSVRVATTANISLTAPGTTIDGVTMVSGDRVLVRAQTTLSENGIYIWNGSASTMTRASDADTWDDIVAAFTIVEQGTTLADSVWVCTSNRGGTLGTTSLPWRRVAPTSFQISGGDATAGTTVDFDGLSTVVLPLTLTNTGVSAGTYTRVVVNAQGRVTSGTSSNEAIRIVDSFTGNGSTTGFTLSRAPGGANDVIVSVGGVVQRPTTDYSVTGTTLAFIEAPQSNTPIWVLHLGPAADVVVPQLTRSVNTFTGTGAQTAFTLSTSVGGANDVLVSVGGIIRQPTTDYTVSGSTLTFTTAPANGTPIWVMILGVTTVVTGVSAGSTNNITARWTFQAGLDTGNSIRPTSSNSIDIGTSTLRFDTVYANVLDGQATMAQLADVAERYEADAVYEPGTVVVFGGEKEITVSTTTYDHRVAGVISTAPAYMMNSAAGNDATHPYVGLVGRLPCKVVGPVQKGDLLVTSSVPGHAMAASMVGDLAYRVVGKALENKDDDAPGIVEIALVRA